MSQTINVLFDLFNDKKDVIVYINVFRFVNMMQSQKVWVSKF